MRPWGEIRSALVAGFEFGPGTARDMAMRTGVGLTATRDTLNNLRRSGEVIVIDSVRMEGVKRPVPVYDRAGPGHRAEAVNGPDWSLITCWAQWPAGA